MTVTEGRTYLLHSRTVFAHWTLAAIVPESTCIEEAVTLEKLDNLSVLIISGYVCPDNRVLEPALGSAVSVAGYRNELAGLRDDIDRVLESRGQAFRDALFKKYTGYPESFFSGQ